MSTTVEEIEKTEISQDKKDELLLDSLEIRGYRCFEHLKIEKLGRVNLIVGKNNVGKTALLEALKIWAEIDNIGKAKDVLDEILYLRNEKSILPRTNTLSVADNFSYRHLLFDRPLTSNIADLLSFSVSVHNKFFLSENVKIKVRMSKYAAQLEIDNVTNNGQFHQEIKNFYCSTKGLDENLAVQIWDDILIQNEEDEAIRTIKIILEDIEDLDFINYPRGSEKRVPVVRVKGIKERVPLKSFGEGMTRLLGISLTLFYCKNGLLLFDEIENGLHYSVLPDVWKLIFKTAKDLNVQVFATTHSKDCIEAFAQAADNSPEDGMLIRLERQGEKIVAKTIEEERLVDAVNFNVEVR
jgi:AAA15 family ATPase/GTPase